MGIKQVLGNNVRRKRMAMGYQQKEFALKLSYYAPGLSEIENAKRWPGDKLIDKLAETLKCEVWELFKDENDRD